MFFETIFGQNGYRFTIKPGANEESFVIADEASFCEREKSEWREYGDSGNANSLFVREANNDHRYSYKDLSVYSAICSWKIYHFHDTSEDAPMRHAEIVQDNETLRTDAANIAPFLLRMREENTSIYRDILNTCRIVVPYLDDFLLKPIQYGPAKKVSLSWKTKASDYPMQPYHLSDGSIRFICLAAALLQPDPPSTIIIDEPELGLHPEAISLLGELMKNAATRSQLIIATQSPLLLDQFSLADVVIVSRRDGQSVFERLNREDYNVWLEDYSVGELWAKNVIRGGSEHE